MTLVAAGVALFGFDKSVAILLLVGLGGFSYTYYHRGHRLYFFFLLRLRGLRLALQVLTSNICLFFFSSSISSVQTVVPVVAISDLKPCFVG